jgi:hypothetical protein
LILVLVARQRAVRGTIARSGSRVIAYEELILTRAAKGRRSACGLLDISGIVSTVEASSASDTVVG